MQRSNFIRFLIYEEIIAINNAIINKYGGKKGLRDKALLESAIHQPLATFNNTILHQTIHDMTAVYFFQIIKNNPLGEYSKQYISQVFKENTIALQQ